MNVRYLNQITSLSRAETNFSTLDTGLNSLSQVISSYLLDNEGTPIYYGD